jgi:hypothetical protein
MRRRSVVAAAALIAVVALAGLPAPAGSRTTSTQRAVEPASLTALTIPALDAAAPEAAGVSDAAPATSGADLAVPDAALRSDGYLAPDATLAEPGSAPVIRATRPRVDQPASPTGSAWKAPKYTLSGYATFYDNGTTAMRLPRGTVVRICGEGGCIERTVTDYGPVKESRIVDLYRPDFFRICGCEWFAGTTWVTVSVY